MSDIMNHQQDNEIEEIIVCTAQFDNTCRTCLSEDGLLFNLMEMNTDNNKTFSDMLYECTSIQVLENDRLPKVICEACVKKINTFYEFKLNCLKSEQTILNQLDELDKFKLEIVKTEDFDDYVPNPNDTNNETLDSDDEDKTSSIKRKKRRKQSDGGLSEIKWFTKVDGVFKCTICGEEKIRRNLLKQHVVGDHSDLFSFKCTYCNDIFTKKFSLKRHISSCHITIKQEKVIKEEQNEYSNETGENLYENEIKLEDDEAVQNEKVQRLLKLVAVQYESGLPSKEELALVDEKIEKLPKGYRCKICSKTRNNSTNMVNHIFFHLGIKHYKCPECDKRFVTTSNANRHIKTTHCSTNPDKQIRSKNKRTCQLCDEIFPTLRLLQKHLSIDHKQKIRRGYDPVTCNICHKTVYNNNALKKHYAGIHLQKQYSCDLCGMSYRSEKGLMGHRRVHGEKSGYHCKFCLVTCSTQQELDDHVDNEHKNAKMYVCPICSKEFYIVEYLQKHIKNHTAKPKHLCTICGRTFLLKSNLTTHSRVHTGEKPYVCKICNATFSQHSALRFHSAIHNDERRFECDICGSKWKRKTDLTQHIRIHSETPKYKCDFCGKAFIFRKRLTSHMRIHTGEKPFECSYCEKTFRRSGHLKVHVRTHTGERPYVCSVCNRGFIQNHCLITHMNTHHKDVL